MAASYSSVLSIKHSLDTKLVLESDWYKKLFPKINFILGNNAVEEKGVKSNFFRSDLAVFRKYYSQL